MSQHKTLASGGSDDAYNETYDEPYVETYVG